MLVIEFSITNLCTSYLFIFIYTKNVINKVIYYNKIYYNSTFQHDQYYCYNFSYGYSIYRLFKYWFEPLNTPLIFNIILSIGKHYSNFVLRDFL